MGICELSQEEYKRKDEKVSKLLKSVCKITLSGNNKKEISFPGFFLDIKKENKKCLINYS